MAPRAAWLSVYAISGALQPLLVDRLRRQGLAPQVLLGPMLANCVGMAVVGPLRAALGGGDDAPGDWVSAARGGARTLATAVGLDFGSAALLTVGLLRCGATAFTLIYSSCALLVALLSTAAGARPSRAQWCAVALATAGLVGYEAADGGGVGLLGGGGARASGAALALLGSAGHSAVYVYAEHALQGGARRGLTPFRLSSLMGFAEAIVLGVWVAASLAADPALRPASYGRVLRNYAPLAAVDAAHALAFFATIGEKGAVAAAMLKGVQVALVFAASAALGCDPATGAGCATPAKTAAVTLVVAGLGLFHSRPPPQLKAASPPPSPPSPPPKARTGRAVIV
jgi:hypothetical protein